MFHHHRPNALVRAGRYTGVIATPTIGRAFTDAATHVVGVIGMEGLRSSGRGAVKAGRRVAKAPIAQDAKAFGRSVSGSKLVSTAGSAIFISLLTDVVRDGMATGRTRYSARPAAQQRAARRAARRVA